MLDSGFFPSTSGSTHSSGAFVGNNAKGANFLASTFHHLAGSGVSAIPTTGFAITIKTGLTITVQPGWGVLNGYPFELPEAIDITLVPASSPTTHYIGVKILRDGNDVPIGFTNDDVYAMSTFDPADALCFGYIDLIANATTIAVNDVHDTRHESAYCGIVEEYRSSLAALADAYNAAIANTTAAYNAFVAQMTADYEATVADIVANGVPGHHEIHEPDGSDPLTGYVAAATLAMVTEGGVFSGGAVSAQGTPNQTVAIEAGIIITPQGFPRSFNAVAALAASAADATNPRIDIVYVSAGGVVTYLAGTAAATPAQPATPSNGTILAALTRAANDNAISAGEITDQRDSITKASDFETVVPVADSSNVYTCDFGRHHTRNFSLTIGNTTAKSVVFANVPFGECTSIVTIRATATAAVTFNLDGRTVVWPNGTATLTSGYTYDILIDYSKSLGKWVARPQIGVAN